MRNKIFSLINVLVSFLFRNLQEIVFLFGLGFLSCGAFMINNITGVISTGVMLTGLSFLLGGD